MHDNDKNDAVNAAIISATAVACAELIIEMRQRAGFTPSELVATASQVFIQVAAYTCQQTDMDDYDGIAATLSGIIRERVPQLVEILNEQ